MYLLVLKHEKEVYDMKEEINTLKTLVQSMALQIVSYIEKGMSSKAFTEDHKDQDKVQDKEEVTISEPEFECHQCSFKNEQLLTLNRHMNTKHENQKIRSVDTKNKLNKKKNCDDGKKTISMVKFFCDECDFSSTNKKTLKKHKTKDHHIDNDCVNCTAEEACEVCVEAE